MKALQCIWCCFFTHKGNFMPAQWCKNYLKIFVMLHLCYKYKNNHWYHVSKEDVKMVALFRCWVLFVSYQHYWFHCWFHNNIIAFICLKSLQWNHVTFSWFHFLRSLFTRHHISQYLKIFISIFFSALDSMSCHKFQKPMTKPMLKESVAK